MIVTRAKVTLNKFWYKSKIYTKRKWIPIQTIMMKVNKAMAQEIPEDIQGILSSHKISEKCNDRDVFYIKSCT